MDRFPFFRQLDAMDCGPACLRMVARHHGKNYSLQYLRDHCYIDRQGVSLKGISEAAEIIGLRTLAVKIPFDGNGSSDAPSLKIAPLPLIAHWNQQHFLVVYKINKRYIWIADPAAGKLKLKHEQFNKHWLSDGDKGIALLLEPGIDFLQDNDESAGKKLSLFTFFAAYLRPFKRLIINLGLGLLLTAFFQLAFPFLTQAIVDTGIENKDIGFIWLILGAQLMLFFGQTVVQFIEGWIFLHISTRVGIGLVSDFLHKLIRLPIGFFDTKFVGDLMQRIGDQQRIESFLTQSTFQIILSFLTIIIFGAVLSHYSFLIFGLFLAGTLLYFGWIAIFLKKRKEIDYQAFQKMADNQHALIEIIQGMPEIKLQGSQRKRRWAWGIIQAKLFRVQMRSLAIVQWQDGGAQVINQLKDILISFLSAKAVVDGHMTLGMMLAVQYMVGKLNAPLHQMMGFVRSAQDASISLERLGEVQDHPDEEPQALQKQQDIPVGDIQIAGLSFKYNPISEVVLDNINLVIPRGKVTAIVGTSGSGKTTLIKLLLGFYQPTAGKIFIGNTPLSGVSIEKWRAACGVVLQDGYIFSDTIANNIAESDDNVNHIKLTKAIQTANISEFIDALSLGTNTMIGARGNGISQGQRQRMLIARAVYKDPDFIILDEATNALDANNESVILQNMEEFFKGRTVIVIAHRLSTVSQADQIVVLDKGRITEIGTHNELTARRGAYFTLVKNQLELGN